MLIEKSLMDALREFIKGKPVTVLWQGEDGGMQVSMLSELLDQEENHYLVNVPVMENPEFPKAKEDALPRKEEKSCPPLLEPENPLASPAGKTKQEQIRELLDRGLNHAEIVKKTGIKSGTVGYYIHKIRSEASEKSENNSDRHKCKSCRFRGKRSGCDYIEIVGHSRGCSVEACTVYEQGERPKDTEKG